jgi:3-isopropylmalate dehydrogenase
VTGSIGLAASANIGDEKAMFEPIHGAAFDIAGKGVANPTAMILSAAWLLKWLGEKSGISNYVEAGKAVESAIERVLSEGKVLTPDLGGSAKTIEFAEAVAVRI